MVRWPAYAVIGALGGAAVFFLLLRTQGGVAPFVGIGIVTAGTEAVLARRLPTDHPPSMLQILLRAGLAFLLAAGIALGVFAMLFAGFVAP